MTQLERAWRLEIPLHGGNDGVRRHYQIDRLMWDVLEQKGCTVDEVVNWML
jgi:hypothetical protein